MSEHTLHVTVNGQARTVTVAANRLLLHVLRDGPAPDEFGPPAAAA